MRLSDKSVQDFREIFKKEYNKELTDDEARESAQNIFNVYELLFDLAMIQLRREKRLKTEKIKGFFLEAGHFYTCNICGETREGNEIWWSKKGNHCADCWHNIQNKVIPDLANDSDNKVYIKDWQLKSYYGIHPMTARKMRRLGELVGRDLKRKDGRTYCNVYLVKENKQFFETHPKKPKIKVIYRDPTGREKVV